MKENTVGPTFLGLCTIIEIPSDMKGLENSMTRSRSDDMVKGAIAKSASYLKIVIIIIIHTH
jgi:hypothetical protein